MISALYKSELILELKRKISKSQKKFVVLAAIGLVGQAENRFRLKTD